MTTSIDVMEHIGDVDLLLPRRIQAGLSANNRLKYYLTLLQAAVAAARDPQRDVPALRETRIASGVTDATLDDVVARSRAGADGMILVPDAARIRQCVFADLREMLAPVQAAAQVAPDLQEVSDGAAARLQALEAATPAFDADLVTAAAVDALAAARTGGQDSVHQLVMDLHHQINRLQTRLPLRDIAGASTWGLNPGDDDLVRAFMEGLARTAALKFDHPGLETSATRIGDRLSIQNDLGTTDAHVVVLHVEQLTVTVIYSDIHRRRIEFLKTMLGQQGVTWDDVVPGTRGAPVLVTGRVTVDTDAALQQLLAFFASRLVFLIDWNRARKQLARFAGTPVAVAVLAWAAERGIGHRAFLQCGGAGLVYAAVARTASRGALAGGRLDEQLGRTDATVFLQSVLRLASAGLASGRSSRAIQDAIEAELRASLDRSAHNGLNLVADHASYVSTLAERVRRVLLRTASGAGREEAERGAQLAKRWEARADDLVRRQRERCDPGTGDGVWRILQHGDDAADGLEEAAFLLTLVPDDAAETCMRPLASLADAILDAARDYVRSVEHARALPPGRSGADLDECLAAVDRVVELERATDRAERQALATWLATTMDFRAFHVASAAARALEEAADALAHAALAVRDYALRGGTPLP